MYGFNGIFYNSFQIASEFAKILLHTTDSCGVPDFVAVRLKSMTALAVQCPFEVGL
jgi:hypothetical protein